MRNLSNHCSWFRLCQWRSSKTYTYSLKKFVSSCTCPLSVIQSFLFGSYQVGFSFHSHRCCYRCFTFNNINGLSNVHHFIKLVNIAFKLKFSLAFVSYQTISVICLNVGSLNGSIIYEGMNPWLILWFQPQIRLHFIGKIKPTFFFYLYDVFRLFCWYLIRHIWHEVFIDFCDLSINAFLNNQRIIIITVSVEKL